MNLFQSDIFSSNEASFIPIENSKVEIFKNTVLANYSLGCLDVMSIEQLNSNEINSNNYRVIIGNDSYLMKKYSNQSRPQEIETILSLNKLLHDNKMNVAKVYENKQGFLLTVNTSDNSYWALYDFIEGDFFSGKSEKELLSTANAISSFQKYLCSYDDITTLEIDTKNYFDNTDKLIQDIQKVKNEWETLFSKEISEYLEVHWEYIKDIYIKVREHDEMFLSHLKLTHIDLHPHNILLKDNDLQAIIDLDSIKIDNYYISLAFSIYKLLRQSIVSRNIADNPSEIKRIVQLFYNKMIVDIPELNEVKQHLHIYANAEILRRLFLILSLNLYEKNTEWNHVFYIQGNGLQESEVIFGCLV